MSVRPWLRALRRRLRGGGVILGIAFSICVGCTPPPPPAAPHTQPAASLPRVTLARLMELRTAHKYREMSALIVPQRAQQVEDFLMALDDFLAANGRLGNWLASHGAMGLALTIDQAYVADNLDVYAGDALSIFGRRVELLDASAADDQAVVSFTVGDRVPAKKVLLRRIDGLWRYDPGPGYSEHLPAAFHDLARGLDQVTAELETGRISDADLRSSPNVLLEKVQSRMRRGVGLLSKAQAAAAGNSE